MLLALAAMQIDNPWRHQSRGIKMWLVHWKRFRNGPGASWLRRLSGTHLLGPPITWHLHLMSQATFFIPLPL